MAPSPTGFFHVGSARTALFNYLFARHHGGTFVLRVEDTDRTRNEAAYEDVIFEAMAWLGLEHDEGPDVGGNCGPYRQSERFDIYRRYVESLVQQGAAYPAYETAEELTAMREAQAAAKQPPRYNGAHRELTEDQRAAYVAEGRKAVVRLRVPRGETRFDDLVYGSVRWKNAEIDDFVIQKSDGGPTYNFACVVDDHLMEISHVIRGEDGLSNTPRQLLLYAALGWHPPQFAHVPFILGPDRKKLSKRHTIGGKEAAIPVRLLDYPEHGILSDAMFNYLALLGWNAGEGEQQEVFTRQELIERFTLGGVNKAGAIFDVRKLAWMNGEFMKKIPVDQFLEQARPYLTGVADQLDLDPEYTRRALTLARDRMRPVDVTVEGSQAMEDITGGATFFFTDDFPMDPEGAAKHLTPTGYENMAALRTRLAELPEWSHDGIEAAIRTLAEERAIKPAALIHPARLLVSGRTVGPSLFELLLTLGRDRVLRRLGRPAQP